MKKSKIIIIAVTVVVLGLIVGKFMTDKQMRDLFAKEAEEKKNEIVQMVKTGELPKEDPTERAVKIDGLNNMRDLGGVKTPHGEIKEHKIYRSETLYYLTDEGVEKMNKMNFDVIVDFRGDGEIEHHPNKELKGVDYVRIPVTNPADIAELIPAEHIKEIRMSFAEGDFDRFNELLDKYGINIDERKNESYIDFAKHFTKQFSEFLHVLLEKDNKKVLFHCEGGKDRTGFAAVVFYKLLGVNEELYKEDFLLTNTLTAEQNKPILAKMPESLYPTVIADWHHMQGVLGYIDQEYGNFDNYRKEGLGISDIELEYLIEKYTD